MVWPGRTNCPTQGRVGRVEIQLTGPRSTARPCAAKILGLVVITIFSSGCSNRPPRLVVPKLDPDTIVAQALESYDSDSDGELSGAELVASPGLQSNLAAYDADGDKKLSESELREQIGFLAKLNFALSALRARVELNGKPLEGAQVELIPEPHFADQIKPAHGVTDGRGVAVMSIPDDDLPKGAKRTEGCTHRYLSGQYYPS